MMRHPEDNLRREIPAQFAAQWAGDHNGLERECCYTGRHVPPASFALDHEPLSSLNSEGHQNQHRRTQGESPEKAIPAVGQLREIAPQQEPRQSLDIGLGL